MTSSNTNPQWPANGKISLQTDSQSSENWTNFRDVSHSVKIGQTVVVDVFHTSTHEFDRCWICNRYRIGIYGLILSSFFIKCTVAKKFHTYLLNVPYLSTCRIFIAWIDKCTVFYVVVLFEIILPVNTVS